MSDSDCVFCSIVAGDAPAYVVHETARTLAFLDAEPAAEGHALVVPKPHHETLPAIPPDLAGDLFRSVRAVADGVDAALDPDGITVHQSNGAAAGQDVFHAHVHVIPRAADDGIAATWPRGDLPPDGATAVARRLADAIGE